jgi:hypothetical protein
MHDRAGMSSQDKSLNELATSAADRLSALRAEAALQIHLAGMDARSAWDEVGPEVEALEARLKEAVGEATSGQAALELHLLLMDARTRWERISMRLRNAPVEAVKGVERAFSEMGTRLDKPQ